MEDDPQDCCRVMEMEDTVLHQVEVLFGFHRLPPDLAFTLPDGYFCFCFLLLELSKLYGFGRNICSGDLVCGIPRMMMLES